MTHIFRTKKSECSHQKKNFKKFFFFHSLSRVKQHEHREHHEDRMLFPGVAILVEGPAWD
jgi:hypothetical protein